MAKRQVNILLTQEERDLLEAVAFVEEKSTSELLRPVISAYLNKQRNDPDVGAALAALTSRRARGEGRVSDLPQRATSEPISKT